MNDYQREETYFLTFCRFPPLMASSFIENAPPVRCDTLSGYPNFTARRIVVKLDNSLAIPVRPHVRVPIQRTAEVLRRGHQGIIRHLERGRHVVTLEVCAANAFLHPPTRREMRVDEYGNHILCIRGIMVSYRRIGILRNIHGLRFIQEKREQSLSLINI